MNAIGSPGIPPQPDSFSEPYWEAAREGRLLIQRCTSCDRYQFYPRPFCAHCFTGAPEWVEAAGTGIVQTFSPIYRTADQRFAGDVPYVLAVVTLDEGVQMTTRIVGVSPDDVRCDMPVRVTFVTGAGGYVLPCFGPSEAAGGEASGS